MTEMSQECPQLALDDIVHFMSPSPAPQSLLDDSDMPPRINSTSPEPLPESDIAQMRRKVSEMRHIDRPNVHLTSREKELAEMVLRLTAMVRPDSDQLHRQADTISALVQQRDLLLHQAEEQRLRWKSEKDGWARMAEALLAQQAKNRLGSEGDEDIGRLHSAETDNKGLRQRLNETQSRLQLLESELVRLRPLLLMQPLIPRSSMPPPTPNPKTKYARRRKKDAPTMEDEEHAASEEEVPMDPFDTPSNASHSQATPRVKSRKLEAPNVHLITNSHKRRPQKVTTRGLSADARVEHLLLAARRIGKHRAGIMSGMVHQLEDRERERRREESATTAVASTPKTPKRNTAHASYPPDGGYVYMGGQVRPGTGIQAVPLFIPAYPHHLLQTPSSSTTAPSVASSAQKAKQDARTNNPPTPLDSLLSAARSMMREDVDVDVDEDEEADIIDDSPSNARSPQPRDTLGSPVPKRRKVLPRTDKLVASHKLVNRASTVTASATSVDTSGVTNTGAGRVRSALDVLADQAAAFSTQEQSVASPQTEAQMRGKGKERADTPLQEPSDSTSKSRGRTKSRMGEAEMDTPFATERASRSRTPRSDLGDNLTGPTSGTTAGGSASEGPVDPGGGTSSATASNPPLSQTLNSTLVSERDQVTTTSNAQGTTSQSTDDLGDITPRQGSRVRSASNEVGTRSEVAQPSMAPLPVPSMREGDIRETPPLPLHSEAAPSGAGNGVRSSSEPGPSSGPARNKGLTRVAEQDMFTPTPPAKRPRSPYVKWSKEEDDLLAQAVAKYGQKWDLVQKALPSRGYHQVRQRWLRKLGVFDSKPDLSSFQTAATTYPSAPRGDSGDPRGNLKLGLAPLSSERAFSGLARKSPSMPL